MPTNKEIAKWLREAAERHMLTHGDDRWAETLLKRANLIKQMCCETCRWWKKFSIDIYGECLSSETRKAMDSIIFPGPQFYCCHWEGKE